MGEFLGFMPDDGEDQFQQIEDVPADVSEESKIVVDFDAEELRKVDKEGRKRAKEIIEKCRPTPEDLDRRVTI